MNRNSPVPLWAALTIGVVVLAGVYVFALRFVAPPRQSTAARPTLVSSQPSGFDIATPTIAPSMTPAEMSVATSPQVDMSDWRTYRNRSYRFEFRYPADWAVSTPGEGEASPATGRESVLSVVPQLGDARISFEIYRFSSPEIGTYFQSAKSLNDYLSLLTLSSSSKSSITFLKTEVIGEKQATWFRICPVTLQLDCLLQAYFENDGVIYKVVRTQYAEDPTFDRVLSTFKFVAGQ